jgi:ABC-2 type transport system ATP-binding protein
VSEQVAVEVASISKKFGDIKALDGITLRVRRGEIYGLLGPNGAGKTTLIRSIVGLIQPDSGTVTVLGRKLPNLDVLSHVGYMTQQAALYPGLSVEENVRFFAAINGVKGSVKEVLEFVDLYDRRRSVVATLSGGMRQRCSLACALVHGPELLLLDEPTVGVDPQSRNRIFEMIETLRAEGMAVIYTTHYMEEAERLCDRIAIIDHGRVIALGTKEELVREAFGDQNDVLMHFSAGGKDPRVWTESRGGRLESDVAHFTVARPPEIGELLDAAARDGLDVVDVILRRPNLESLFLRLTGRALRE